MLISLYRFEAFSNELVLLVPLAYLCVSAVMFFGLILIDQLRRRHGAGTANVRGDSVLKSLLIAPTDYGVLCLVFLTFGWPTLFVALYGAAAGGEPAVPAGRDRQVVPGDGGACSRLRGVPR